MRWRAVVWLNAVDRVIGCRGSPLPSDRIWATARRISTCAIERLRLRTARQRPRLRPVLETEPVGVPGDQPRFLNAAVVGETTLDRPRAARPLLAIERDAGRERPLRRRRAHAGSRPDPVRRRHHRRARLTRAAPAVSGAALRARAARRDCARLAGSGDGPDDRGAAGGAASVKKAESSEAFPPPSAASSVCRRRPRC